MQNIQITKRKFNCGYEKDGLGQMSTQREHFLTNANTIV